MKNLTEATMGDLCELAGIPNNPVMEAEEKKDEGGGKSTTASVIKALGNTDYRDKDAFFKMTQLLKGLAVASEKDETAKKFMSSVSDALTGIAKKSVGEDVQEGGSSEANTVGKAIDVMNEVELDTKSMLKSTTDIARHAASAAKDLAKGKTRMAVASLTDVVSNVEKIYTELAKKYGVLYEPKDALRRSVMEMDKTARQTARK